MYNGSFDTALFIPEKGSAKTIPTIGYYKT